MAHLDIRSLLVSSLLIGVGIGLGKTVSFNRNEPPRATPFSPVEFERSRIDVTVLTSPFLECIGERDYDPRLRRARAHILDYLGELQAADTTLRVSVYARDLLDGPWMGIDEREPFHPASLMKVPVLFHALARIETEPELRTRSFLYPGSEAMPSPDNLLDRPPEERMEAGRSYTYAELLERLIVYSDNHAKDLILTGVDPADIDAFMEALGIPTRVESGEPVMDARDYGALFRMLYNSTVFSRPSSEYALSLLSRAHYAEGIRAPLPPEVLVASKFGVYRDALHPEDGTQLHECGIVYADRGPYVLCVMSASRTKTAEELAPVLARVSEVVYFER